MPRKRYTPEDMIQHLRTVELDAGKGLAVLDACRKLGITEQTSYRGKKEYGGLRVDQAKRLKGLEQENLRLKRIVAAGVPYRPFAIQANNEVVRRSGDGIPAGPYHPEFQKDREQFK